jgi:hypothetical protein
MVEAAATEREQNSNFRWPKLLLSMRSSGTIRARAYGR